MSKQEPIPMPTSNRFVKQEKKQLYAISPEELEVIKRLRAETGAGLHDCKTALRDADGDYDKAVEALRHRPLAVLTNVKMEE